MRATNRLVFARLSIAIKHAVWDHDKVMPVLIEYCCEGNKAGQLGACKCTLQITLQEAYRQHIVLPNAWGLILVSIAEMTHILSCI